MLDFLQALYDFGYRVVTGNVPASQTAAIQQETEENMRRAGATQEQIKKALGEVANTAKDLGNQILGLSAGEWRTILIGGGSVVLAVVAMKYLLPAAKKAGRK